MAWVHEPGRRVGFADRREVEKSEKACLVRVWNRKSQNKNEAATASDGGEGSLASHLDTKRPDERTLHR